MTYLRLRRDGGAVRLLVVALLLAAAHGCDKRLASAGGERPLPAHALPDVGLRVAGVDRPVRLEEALRTLPVVTLDTLPPAYHGAAKRYRGVDLHALLGEEGATLRPGTTLTFVCADGYRSQLDAAVLLRHRGVLAWAEVDLAGQARPFELVQFASGKRVDPGPLFVVWPPDAITDTYPAGWPFAVLRIEVEAQAPTAPIDPKRLAAAPVAPEVQEGFGHWARICFACHSLNGVGGRIGPELNRPRNITSYFAQDALIAFMRDWRTVREPHGNEKMPRLAEQLSEAQAATVVAYLRFMAGQQRSGPPPPHAGD